MGKQMIITISREFGSGGHDIADRIAKDLNLPMYDRNLLDEIACEKQTETEKLEKYDEKPKNLILSRRVRGFSNSIEENLAEMQFTYLKKKADSGESFVVVGRCSESILRGREGLITFFILGDREVKKEHVMKKYNLSENEALIKMHRHDKSRKQYHNSYSMYKWGDSRGYDICINSSRLGFEGTVAALEQYIEGRRKLLDK